MLGKIAAELERSNQEITFQMEANSITTMSAVDAHRTNLISRRRSEWIL
jgi:hypothetical protein